LEDLGRDGRIILKMVLEVGLRDSMDWIYLVEDMDKWRTLVNAVMQLRVS
jgi:hypothetical protein